MSFNPFASTANETKAIKSSVRSGGVPATNLYEGVIKAAYLRPNQNNSKNMDMSIHIELPSGYEHIIKNTVLIDNSTTQINKKTGKPELLYGYQQVSHIVGAATEGKTMNDLHPSIQKKSIELYDYSQRKDVLTEVDMVTDLIGKPLLIGLQKKIDNKKGKVDDAWVDLPERKETLVFGCAGSATTRKSFNEMNENAEAADIDKWVKLNSNPNGTMKVWDAYTEVAGAASGVPAGVPAAQPASAAPIDFGSQS